MVFIALRIVVFVIVAHILVGSLVLVFGVIFIAISSLALRCVGALGGWFGCKLAGSSHDASGATWRRRVRLGGRAAATVHYSSRMSNTSGICDVGTEVSNSQPCNAVGALAT
jgi:hypothetical protein